jgi:uncharacterized membrane protein (UPF0127 family)
VPSPHFLAGAGGRTALLVEGRPQPVVERLDVPADSAGRRRGLLGRDRLDEHTGMVIAPSGAVHTFFMRFPIDLVFAARNGRVLRVCHRVKPWRIRAARGAFAVVELAAGVAARHGVSVGDQLRVGAPAP